MNKIKRQTQQTYTFSPSRVEKVVHGSMTVRDETTSVEDLVKRHILGYAVGQKKPIFNDQELSEFPISAIDQLDIAELNRLSELTAERIENINQTIQQKIDAEKAAKAAEAAQVNMEPVQ